MSQSEESSKELDESPPPVSTPPETERGGAIEIPKTGIFGGLRGASFVRSAQAFQEPSVFDAAAGAFVALLAILGLAGAAPRSMAALAFMVIGAALIVEGAGVTERYRKMALSHNERQSPEISTAALIEIAGGAVSFCLGAVALLGFAPFTLMSLASIVLGGSLLLGTGAAIEIDSVRNYFEPTETRRVIHQAVVAAGGARLLVACGCVTLGVLALFGVAPVTLLLASALSSGGALLLGAVASADRLSPLRAQSH